MNDVLKTKIANGYQDLKVAGRCGMEKKDRDNHERFLFQRTHGMEK